MKTFNLYEHILNEGNKYSSDDLQRMIAELVYAVYSTNKEQYQAIMDGAIDNINESLGYGLPYEGEQIDKYNGYKNRDTWLVALWLTNHEANYRLMIEQYKQGNGVAWDDKNQYYYGDKINFLRVAVDEIEAMIIEDAE